MSTRGSNRDCREGASCLSPCGLRRTSRRCWTRPAGTRVTPTSNSRDSRSGVNTLAGQVAASILPARKDGGLTRIQPVSRPNRGISPIDAVHRQACRKACFPREFVEASHERPRAVSPTRGHPTSRAIAACDAGSNRIRLLASARLATSASSRGICAARASACRPWTRPSADPPEDFPPAQFHRGARCPTDPRRRRSPSRLDDDV